LFLFFCAKYARLRGQRVAFTSLLATLIALSAGHVQAQTAYELVHPLVGSDHEGQTAPFVGPPYAMTSWTPETRTTEAKCIAPYYFADKQITGFRASHWMSGSCSQEYGSVTVMPVTGEYFEVDPGVRGSGFDRATEHATPASYSVTLARYATRVEMTATARSGVFRITYPAGASATLLFQPYAHPNEGFVQVLPDRHMVVGYNPVHRIYQGGGQTTGFSGYFAARLDHSFPHAGTWCGTSVHPGMLQQGAGCAQLGAFVSLGDTHGRAVELMVGTSFTSLEEAEKNLDAETSGRGFDAIQRATETQWHKSLSTLAVEGGSTEQRSVFYTALYHSLLGPRPVNDADGSYNGFAQSGLKHLARGEEYYDDYSMWDTFRALHPLLTLIDPKRQERMVQSLVLKGEQGGFLPIFPLWNNYTSEMVGDHIAVLFADAYQKGLRHFDVDAAYRLAMQNATVTPPRDMYVDGKGRRALDSYVKYGYIPLEDPVADAFHHDEQVSRTLEYAYDDAMLGDLADALGKTADAAMLHKRSENWRNVFDSAVGFVRGRHADGTWVMPFDPAKPASYITEGLPWQYTFFVPQNIPGLIEAMGGRDRFIAQLDGLFDRNLYDQGNEPSHHIAYLYNAAGAPAKTEQRVREMMALYTDAPGGLPGNDDDGQMSAWWVMSSIGIYQVCPGRPVYSIGSPLFHRVTLHHADGTTFVIETTGNSDRAAFIRAATLNGKPLTVPQIDHASLMRAGHLVLEMSDSPNPNAFDPAGR
jgi:predicted alpha-1,2-mannosidase